MSNLFEQHYERLQSALAALQHRQYWHPFQESPSARFHPPGAKDNAYQAYRELLGKPFDLGLPPAERFVGNELSPYTLEPLGITYPQCSVDALMQSATEAMSHWQKLTVQDRAGILLEMVSRLEQCLFENAFATMHTTGQGFLMAYSGNGVSALERGLEGLSVAYHAVSQVPEQVNVEGHFGRRNVNMEKRYRLHGVGVAVVMACGSYPAWNALPAIFANLMTGNAVIVKPHPGTILPVAWQVKRMREVLAEQGIDPDLLTLMPETQEQPMALTLLDHPATAIVDFTGSQAFGHYLETHYRHLQVYTETAGCNAVILESVENLDAVLTALAHSLCLFSSQMCTSPQNIFIPAAGVREQGQRVAFAEIAARLVAAVDAIADNPAMAAGTLGALHTDAILSQMERLTQQAERDAQVLRPGTPYRHADFPSARTATPLLVQCRGDQRGLYSQEWFGPMAFLIECENREQAVQLATDDVRKHGAIASFAYSTDEAFIDHCSDGFGSAGASLGCNLVAHNPLNVAAAFSDFHVTGINPAGNASLTDLAFVARRFRITQTKIERGSTAL